MSRRRWATVLVAAAAAVAALTLVNFTGVASAAVSNVLIKGTGSGRCLTPPSTDGATTYIQDCAGQLWSTTSSNQITINGKCLDASGAGVANGTVVTVWTCNGGSNQAWNVNANGTITGVGSGRCLDVFGQYTANGTKVELWDCNGGTNQAWQLVAGGGGGGGGGGVCGTGNTGGPDLTGFTVSRDYEFGTGAGRNTSNLSAAFHPRATLAGWTVINGEWQVYEDFNSTNHHLTANTLDLTAVANRGGVTPGGISSGQIVTNERFYPRNGKTYVLALRAKIPHSHGTTGTWPAFWLYAASDPHTSSEIDIFEFFDKATQDSHDWTGYDHGDTGNVGPDYHNIMTNQWVWHPGCDFADTFHTYYLVWKEGDIQKWVDQNWVKGTKFKWVGNDPEVLINLAIGGSDNVNPTASTFPAVYSIDSFKVYVK